MAARRLGTPSQACSGIVPSVVGKDTLRKARPAGTSPLARIVRVCRPVAGSRPMSRLGWPKSSQRHTISPPSGGSRTTCARMKPRTAPVGWSSTRIDVRRPGSTRATDARPGRSGTAGSPGRRVTSRGRRCRRRAHPAGRSRRSPVRDIPDERPLTARGVGGRDEAVVVVARRERVDEDARAGPVPQLGTRLAARRVGREEAVLETLRAVGRRERGEGSVGAQAMAVRYRPPSGGRSGARRPGHRRRSRPPGPRAGHPRR